MSEKTKGIITSILVLAFSIVMIVFYGICFVIGMFAGNSFLELLSDSSLYY